MTRYALYAPLEARPGQEQAVVDFLRAAVPLIEAEPGTVAWFALQTAPSSFAIFDAFPDEASRDAHLNGKVAAALMAKADELFTQAPVITRLDVIAAKLPR